MDVIKNISARFGTLVGAIALAFVLVLPAGAADGLQFNISKVTLKLGQRINLLTFNGTGVSVSSNAAAVRATMFGRYYVSLYGAAVGSAKVTACSQEAGCAVAQVTVVKNLPVVTTTPTQAAKANQTPSPASSVNASQPPKSTGPIATKTLSLSQTNVRVPSQGTYTVLAESKGLKVTGDTGVVRTAVDGNQITFYGLSPGQGNVTICTATNSCAIVHVVVTTPDSGPFTVSPTTVSIDTNKTAWLSTTYSTSLTASSNSSVVSTKVKNGLVLLTASGSTGKATVKVCNNKTDCVFVYVTVKKGLSVTPVSGSFKSLTLDIGQTADVPFPRDDAISYYLTGNPTNSNVAKIQVNQSSFTVTALGFGATSFRACPLLSEYPCGTIGVTVRDRLYCPAGGSVLQVSDSDVSVPLLQTVDVTANACSNLAAISDSAAARAAVNGGRVTIYGMKIGVATVQVCDTSPNCVPITVRVVPK